MGLKKVLFGLGYYKHVAPTELAATAPTTTLSNAPPRATDCTADATGAFAAPKVRGHRHHRSSIGPLSTCMVLTPYHGGRPSLTKAALIGRFTTQAGPASFER
jgi:hypothetical protein